VHRKSNRDSLNLHSDSYAGHVLGHHKHHVVPQQRELWLPVRVNGDDMVLSLVDDEPGGGQDQQALVHGVPVPCVVKGSRGHNTQMIGAVCGSHGQGRRGGGGASHGNAKRGRGAGAVLVPVAQSGAEAPALCQASALGGGEAMARLDLEIWSPVRALFCKLHAFSGTAAGLESDGLRRPFARLHSGARLHTIHRLLRWLFFDQLLYIY
jgi:hypothetical protein